MQSNKSQPLALVFLFLTELWERFGFYTAQGLIVLIMTQYYGLSDNQSYMIFGAFTSLAYISPIIGGYLADKVLGFKLTIIWGALFLIAGYTLLALSISESFFFVGIGTVVVGTGLLKPSISSLLGAQYNLVDSRREAGFTLFYIGINLGAVLAGLTSGYVKDYFGWHVSFAIAVVGLIIGLATFIYGLRHTTFPENQPVPSAPIKWRILIYCLLSIIGLHFFMTATTLTTYVLPIGSLFLLFYLGVLTLQQTGEDKKNMLVLVLLTISSIVFWTLYWQIFSSANLYVDRLIDRHILGFPISTTVFYTFVNFFIVLLGPLFAWMWHKMSDRGCNPSPFGKFTLGLVFTGLSFLLLSISTRFPNAEGLVNPAWIFFSYLLLSVGELLISPIGLSTVTLLAPVRLVGMMMGVWFVGLGLGGTFSGVLAQFASIPDAITSTSDKLDIYQHAFYDYASIAFVVAIVLFFAHNLAKKLEGK